jgi:hypothetical protein
MDRIKNLQPKGGVHSKHRSGTLSSVLGKWENFTIPKQLVQIAFILACCSAFSPCCFNFLS